MGAEAGAGNTEASAGPPQVTDKELNAYLAKPDREIRGSLFAKVGHILKTYADFVKNPIGFVIGYFKRDHERKEEKKRNIKILQDAGPDAPDETLRKLVERDQYYNNHPTAVPA